MTPTLGRIVHYQLTAGDVTLINQQTPQIAGRRNPVHEGQVYSAQITAVFHPSVNLVVQLDGIAQYWATSRVEGDKPGTWSWPAKVGA